MGTAVRAATASSYEPAAVPRVSQRIASLDIARGIIMVLMAIDHVRVYSGVPAGGPTLGVFFTRWVTHFSAPEFAFLAGTGAFLYGIRSGDKRQLSKFLATRGVFLVLLELTVMRLSWTFNFDVAHYNLAGVLWMLGWCMVMMSALVWLPTTVVGVTGLAIVFLQFVFGPIGHVLPNAIGRFLYLGGGVKLGVPIDILYVIVPWIGVMAAGYWFGDVMTRSAESRRRTCLWIGGVSTAAFVVFATGFALRASGPNEPPLLFRVLAQRKYPASPLFLLMTLGPTILFIPFADRMNGWFARVMTVFGRVPLFFYILHIPLIHALACLVSVVREGRIDPWLFGNHPLEPPPLPAGYMWSLPLLYATWLVAVTLLYLPCRRFAELKAKSRNPWLRLL